MSLPFLYDSANQHDAESMKKAIANKLMYSIGKDPRVAQPKDWMDATFLAVRDQMVERWMETTRAQYSQDVKRVYYLSMEFLIGRALSNALLALDMEDVVRAALDEMGVDYDELVGLEPDAALGNGGLGRLAACFLDSMATLGIPGMGYGIRYQFGMFKQRIIEGRQVEVPDTWLGSVNIVDFPRDEVCYRVRFGGRLELEGKKVRWLDSQNDVLAVAHDIVIPGYATKSTNTLRLWTARSTREINLKKFNQGDYFSAVEEKNLSENVSRVLYPDDSTYVGKELRLRQEYFFVAASLQDIIHRYLSTHDNLDRLEDKVAIHLNDTHPVLAIPELMRILLDDYNYEWDEAWAMTSKVFSYTNHTLMSEALETWPVDMIGRLLPRHLKIIFDINEAFLKEVALVVPNDTDFLRRVSLIEEHGDRKVRMAYLAVVGSHKINGVSALHSDLMVESIFADFARLYPERFTNVTNGVTPRRWLALANPSLSKLIDGAIGQTWRANLTELAELKGSADFPQFVEAFREAKLENKKRLANYVARTLGGVINPHALFDVQVKRIHEYKRQLLNVLHVITRYNQILANPDKNWQPRVVIFAGKAASAYHMAKLVIQLINDVGIKINNDHRIGDKLKVVFLPNYSVSLAEIIIPAADLSEQISTAGTEASGTGNMKFALNGALTIGTLDGANVEMQDAVGADNMFIFGNTTEEVGELRANGYNPRAIYEGNKDLRDTLNMLASGYFSPTEPERYRVIFDVLVNWGDHYQLLADFESYVATQAKVDALYAKPEEWAKRAIYNVAGMGHFSSDRTIKEYADRIWYTKPVKL
ncbi:MULTISPECIES: glycogen/starch/alpha-glucan phosphorylase [Deefgea]|uniref:Alpha-1,4 glucan phosphorylase n=1 Tax=Deefgea chitinilytica TaxID=570276 RepID=A0ABS2CBA9_9NEIS|nr:MULTISPECIES: glycogen/starch/alpha-glucan phosphorylase [Deefgea]MBM5571441.1 glycogen/starch/alpha-glucan family phosphorylase [Deefgea chitinilytica]MBM9888674.1 glycogen/starch/alpha-glucan phosphorylase [Deefgea sp. CFH1-16]